MRPQITDSTSAALICFSSAQSIIVTSHAAQWFPVPYVRPAGMVRALDYSARSQVQDDSGQTVPWSFDRVLCDVPCTGDGILSGCGPR